VPTIIAISQDKLLYQLKLSCLIPGITEQIVRRTIVATKVTEVGIKVEPSELQQRADTFRKENQLLSVPITVEWLERHQLSVDDFEALILWQVQEQKLAQYLFADQVELYFAAHQLDYAGAILYEVVLDNMDLALELFYGLQEGEISFPQVAQQYIQSLEQRRQCGYLGMRRRSELKPEISAAVFGAKPPQILKPITTNSGIYLILVEEIIQPQLDASLSSEILKMLFERWIEAQQLDFQLLDIE
jgi:parvulin-like peptidyl-prolyl isomerase